jgi:predicted DNA-binding protein
MQVSCRIENIQPQHPSPANEKSLSSALAEGDTLVLHYIPMPTKKRRLNITLPKDIALYLEQMALRDEVSQSQKAVELIEEALERDEEDYFVHIAEERIKKGGKYISSEEFWKKVL